MHSLPRKRTLQAVYLPTLKADLEPCPKLLQDLRATRATQLVVEGYPSNMAAGRLEYSTAVADRRRRQTTDERTVPERLEGRSGKRDITQRQSSNPQNKCANCHCR
jgi:hypothetical protein